MAGFKLAMAVMLLIAMLQGQVAATSNAAVPVDASATDLLNGQPGLGRRSLQAVQSVQTTQTTQAASSAAAVQQEGCSNVCRNLGYAVCNYLKNGECCCRGNYLPTCWVRDSYTLC